jgi:tetratricopeptide (TPR) repeat protein
MPSPRFGACTLLALAGCAGVSIDPGTADAALVRARPLSPSEQRLADDFVEAAMLAVDRRDFAAAETAARRALALDPRSARALAVSGIAQLAAASRTSPPDLFATNAGEHAMRLAAQIAPDDPFVGWLHAVFLAEIGHLSAAAEVAEQALARAAAAPAAERTALLLTAGTYRYELGEERAALPHLQAYLALRPDDATNSFRLGSCLLRIAAVPQGIPPSSLLVAQRQAEAAAAAFRRCAALAPGDEDAALAAATAHLRAAELADELAREFGAERRSQDDAGQARNHRDAARQLLQAAAVAFPASAEPWFRLGVIAEAGHEAADARSAYQQALQRDAGHVPSLLNLAALLDRAGDHEAATELWRRALAVDAARPALSAAERRRLRARLGSADQAPRML